MRRLLLSCVIVGLLVGSSNDAQAGGPASAHYARGHSGLFWFQHISDLHVGSEWYVAGRERVEFGLTEAVQVVRPWFVVATGDIVDGSINGIPATGQNQAEWDLYRSIYTTAGVAPDFYFDLPGNHDGYADIGFHHYLANSLQGQTNQALYTSWVVTTPLGEYYFFGLNSAGYGSGPFLENPEFTIDEIGALQTGLQAHGSAELIFLLAHHPLDAPRNSGQVAEALTQAGGGFYLHGHKHVYDEYLEGGGLIVVNQVDSLGKANDNNIGVAVVDHNALVYRATSTRKPWPFVVITAPVDRLLRNGTSNPYAYTVCKDRADNPVRALVFSPTAPSDVRAQVGATPPVDMVSVLQPENVWTADVDTTGLTAGVHDITVTATVGGEVAFHNIAVEFVDGPCAALPEDPGVVDGGVTDSGTQDVVEPDSGAGGTPASGGAAGQGGTPMVDGGSGGGAVDAGELKAEESGDDGGCGCRVAVPRSPGSAAILLFGLAGLWRRRARP